MGKSDLLTGLLIGGAIGYVYGLLNAPRPGDETRQMLNERGRELRDKAIDTLHTTADKTEQLVDQGKTRVVSTLESTLETTRGRADELKNQGSNLIHEVRAQASEKMRKVADQVEPETPAADTTAL